MKKLFTILFLILSAVHLISQTVDQTNTESISSLGAKDIKVTEDPYSEEPDICIDKENSIWIVYTSLSNDEEKILLVKMQDTIAAKKFTVSRVSGFESSPKILCDRTNKIWIVWSAKRNNNWDIYARFYFNEKLSDEFRITDDPEVDIHPSICEDLKGNIIVVWESLRDKNFNIYYCTINEQNISAPSAISTSQNMDLRPSAAVNGNSIIIVWDRQEDDRYFIMLKIHNGNKWFFLTMPLHRSGLH